MDNQGEIGNLREQIAKLTAENERLSAFGLTLADGEIWDPELQAKVYRWYETRTAKVHLKPLYGLFVKCNTVGLTTTDLTRSPVTDTTYTECGSCFMGTVTNGYHSTSAESKEHEA